MIRLTLVQGDKHHRFLPWKLFRAMAKGGGFCEQNTKNSYSGSTADFDDNDNDGVFFGC